MSGAGGRWSFSGAREEGNAGDRLFVVIGMGAIVKCGLETEELVGLRQKRRGKRGSSPRIEPPCSCLLRCFTEVRSACAFDKREPSRYHKERDRLAGVWYSKLGGTIQYRNFSPSSL